MITIEKVIFGGGAKPKKNGKQWGWRFEKDYTLTAMFLAESKGENGIKTETAVNLEDGDKNKI